MFKPLGITVTILLLLYTIVSFVIAIWFYDAANFSKSENRDLYPAYVDTLRAVLAVDFMMFIASIIGLVSFCKPNSNFAKLYALIIVALLLFKIIAGALWYNGVDDKGKHINDLLQNQYDAYESSGETKPNELLAWKAARGNEVASIILFIAFGLTSGVCSVKVSQAN